MPRFFNIAGPCIPGKHYLLPARERCVDLMELIDRELFFVIHAARQSGKTTLLQSLADDLEASGGYHALYCSLEPVQAFTDPEAGIPAIADCLRINLQYHPGLHQFPLDYEALRKRDSATMIRQLFTELCAALDRPLVVLFDEADCLSEGTLITFLRQLRDGYINRARIPFIHSLALVGMRNIRDYKGRLREGGQTLGSASPFNIVSESLTLRNFTTEEVAALYAQHARETGQAFPPQASQRAWEWTQGQPWLVNAIAREVVEKILEQDASRTIEPALIDEAAERLMRRRDTHLDSLLERLKEERVRRIIEPMMAGLDDIDYLSDDYEYVRDLGLIREDQGTVMPANPIYAEVMARTLSHNLQQRLPREFISRWIDAQGIRMNDLLQAFQQFWRENSEAWVQVVMYHEAGPQLVLMAFLQRVVNGGARIAREFASGSRRVDLCVHYQEARYPVELKVWRETDRRDMRAEGLEQLARYMDTLGAREGWLVLFDQRPERPWEERITWADELLPGGRIIHVVGA